MCMCVRLSERRCPWRPEALDSDGTEAIAGFEMLGIELHFPGRTVSALKC